MANFAYRLYLGHELLLESNDLETFMRRSQGRVGTINHVLPCVVPINSYGDRIFHDSLSIRKHITSATKGVLMVGKREGYRYRTQPKSELPRAITVVWNHEAVQDAR